jgi:AmmeMemoRadiSam system protein B
MRNFDPDIRGTVRPPAVAGRFYPRDPVELRRMVEDLLREARAATGRAPKAIIAPHAGYVFSGPIAASAYARLAPGRAVIKRVVLLGPSHYASFEGLAATGAAAFATPLGEVPVDTAAIRDLCSGGLGVRVLDEAHAAEHALEVQLPFLQVVLAEFTIVPLLVGDASDEDIGEVIEALWGGVETRVVISSDLSHYYDYTRARELDAATARAIEQLRPQDISEEQACGGRPIRGLLRAAQRHGLRAGAVDLRNSGDTAGPRDGVVGYGAFGFEEAAG